jgi:peptidoglycan/LPS O-acetylase OafA/YrhL
VSTSQSETPDALSAVAMPRPAVRAHAVPARNRNLDALRFAAVLLVLFRHMTPEPPVDMPALIRTPLTVLIQGAWCGVDMFFVLSGYLVSGLLFREAQQCGTVSFRRFFVRRGWRIYPPFLALLVGYGMLEQLSTHSVTLPRFLAELFFVQNYFLGLWNHTWSLAVEEHFYLAIGLLVAALARRGRIAWAPHLLLAIVVGCTALRFMFVDSVGGAVISQSHFRIDALAFGSLLAWLHTFRPDLLPQRGRPLLVPLGLLLISPAFIAQLEGWHLLTWGLTSLYLGFGAILLYAIGGSPPPFPGSSLLAALGAQSYSVYLWHMAVKRALSLVRRRDLMEWPFFVELGLFICLSFGFGILMARLVELPVLRLRDRYFPARVPAPAT